MFDVCNVQGRGAVDSLACPPMNSMWAGGRTVGRRYVTGTPSCRGAQGDHKELSAPRTAAGQMSQAGRKRIFIKSADPLDFLITPH